MELKNVEVILLHRYPQYLKSCCELINDEWPRSETARMMSLQASCDELPTSLILINEEKHLLGHCKLTRIPSMPNSCFVETVVISKSMRGKKLGTHLMKQVEEYCKNVLKREMIHLSTKGQDNFYAKLGYEVCAPVSIYGSSIPNSIATFYNSDTVSLPTQNIIEDSAIPPPPPPPMPKPQNIINSNLKNVSDKMELYTDTAHIYRHK